MASEPPPKPKMGLSLYANLLDSGSKDTSGATISSAPVVYKQPGGSDAGPDDAASQKQQHNNAALRFQPTKRPQVAAQKKATPAKFAPPPALSAPPVATETRTISQPPKSNLDDWTGDAEDDEFYGSMQRQRGGRKRRKKNKEQGPIAQDWDDIYDPSRPNSYEEYRNSEEKFRELREWKDRLYAHRTARRRRRSTSTDSEDAPRRPAFQFAPPPVEAPPPPPPVPEEYRPPPPPPAEVPDDATGEDAFARRMRLSQANTIPNSNALEMNAPVSDPPHLNRLVPDSGRVNPQVASSTISRAPVRYSLPDAPADLPRSEAELESALAAEEQAEDTAADGEEEPRSLRPGQKGFAERLMAKYGWSKGSGLGANATGIVTPLQAKLEKQKKKPDSEGGGFVGPGGMGKITGGKRKGGEQVGLFGSMSEVIVLRGMVDGMDLQYELGEGNLMQEIGEECGEKYGRVERVYVDQSTASSPSVFIKFTSQLSALRAVNALEGRVFNGNTIQARFFDSEKFDQGRYQ